MSILYFFHTWFYPFVIEGVNDLFLAQVLSILEPVSFHDSASVVCITTEAALFFLREDNVPFAVDNQVLTLGVGVG